MNDRPVLAVSAALRDSEGRFLLVLRGLPPAEGKWAFPGGRVEKGELLVDAARREVMEETGLEAADLAFLEHVEFTGNAGSTHFVLCVFSGRAEGVPVAGDDAARALWCTAEAAETIGATDSTLAIIRRLSGYRDNATVAD